MKADKKHIRTKLKKHAKRLDKTYYYVITDVTIKGKFILTHTDKDYQNFRTSFISSSIDSYTVVN